MAIKHLYKFSFFINLLVFISIIEKKKSNFSRRYKSLKIQIHGNENISYANEG